jgi:hypothetical protein
MTDDIDDDGLLVFDPDSDTPPAGVEVFAEDPAPATPPPYYQTAEEWVNGWLAVMYRRELAGANDRAWCPWWWEHPEAVSRIEALWRAWEHLRRDPKTGMAVWWRDYADPHMTVLFNPEGPFKRCDHRGRHEVLPKIPLADPGGLFTPIPTERKPNVFQRIFDAIRG